MKLSIESFVFLMIKELSTLNYLYESIIKGCIQALKQNYNYSCSATDQEIYNRFIIEYTKIYNSK